MLCLAQDSRKKEPTGWMRNGGGGGNSRKAALTYNPRHSHQRSDELSDSTSADAAARPPPRGGRYVDIRNRHTLIHGINS